MDPPVRPSPEAARDRGRKTAQYRARPTGEQSDPQGLNSRQRSVVRGENTRRRDLPLAIPHQPVDPRGSEHAHCLGAGKHAVLAFEQLRQFVHLSKSWHGPRGRATVTFQLWTTRLWITTVQDPGELGVRQGTPV